MIVASEHRHLDRRPLVGIRIENQPSALEHLEPEQGGDLVQDDQIQSRFGKALEIGEISQAIRAILASTHVRAEEDRQIDVAIRAGNGFAL